MEKMTRFGGFGNFQERFIQNDKGGLVYVSRATSALTVGQCVKFDSNGTLVPCAADTDGPFFIGIVVGGILCGIRDGQADVVANIAAAGAGEDVYVVTDGMVWAKKNTGAGLTAGVLVECGTGGAVAALTTPVFGERIGVVMTTVVSADTAVKIFITKS